MKVERIVLEGVEKRYRWFRLYIDRLVLGEGLNLVIGPNGSGKSTLLKLVAGFIKPSKGVIRIYAGGRALNPEEAQSLMGYVAEDVILPNMRVHELLKAFSSDHIRLKETIELLGLSPLLGKRYLELSAGYRKRVQIAIALLRDVEMLLLDEPFTNIDILMIPVLRRIINFMRGSRVVVVTSHIDIGIVPDNLIILNQGRIVYAGDPGRIMKGRLRFRVRIGGRVQRMSLGELNKIISPITIIDVDLEDISSILKDIVEGRTDFFEGSMG